MKKKNNPKDLKGKKQSQNINLFVPSQYISSVQEETYLTCPEERENDIIKYIPEAEPFEIPPEWEEKTEEEINEELLPIEYTQKEQQIKELLNKNKKGPNQNKNETNNNKKKNQKNKKEKEKEKEKETINTNGTSIGEEEKEIVYSPYRDPMHEELINNLPLSFLRMTENNFLWLTPEEYIINELIDKDIKRIYPKKNYIEMREDIKQFYNIVKEREERERKEKELLEKERLEREERERKEKEEKEAKEKQKGKNKDKILANNKDKKEMKQEKIIEHKKESNEKEESNISIVNKLEEENSMDTLLNDDSFIAKNALYKDFLVHLITKPQIKVIPTKERDETDEEYTLRVTETIEKQKENLQKFKSNKSKNEKKPVVQKPEDIPRNKIITIIPSNINVKYIVDKEKTSESPKDKNEISSNLSFISWLSSIFQFILDLEITDCVTHNSIFNNIYPQKNGTPIINPNGHYIVKLYFMGKPRRIDIDERIPCTKDGEYIFPRCDKLTEIWPALYTKALLKLNVFKVKHPFYSQNEENVDTNFIYAMTGYHAEVIQGLNKEEQIQNLLDASLNDDNFLNKKKYLLCLNLCQFNKNNLYYEEIILKYEKKKEKERNKMSTDIIEESSINEENSTKKLNDLKYDTSKSTKTPKSIQKIIKSKRGSTIIKSVLVESNASTNKNDNMINNKINNQNLENTAQQNFKLFGKNKLEQNYWNSRKRPLKRQKTVKLSGMKFIDNKLNIIVNYAYSINDFFSNGNFNMNRLKPLIFDDLKRNLKESNVVYKQLSEEEKKEYILKRKKLKEKQLILKNQKIEELQYEGKPFLIIKIKNNSIGQYDLNSVLYYSEKEIFMAKKCMLNNWKFPPPDFFNDFFKRTDKLLEEEEKSNNELRLKQQKILMKYQNNPNLKKEQEDLIILNEPQKKKINDFDWTRKDYIYNLLDNNLSKFESTEDHPIKDPILKTSGGNWMSFSDFISLFNAFLVLHNPNALFNGSNLCVDNNWKDYKIDCYEPQDHFMVLKLNNEEIEDKDKIFAGFIIFEPNDDKTLASKNKINNYIIIDIVDEENNIIFKNITMNKFYSTHHIENLKGGLNYYIIIRGGIFQFGYVLQLYSEGHKIENMTYQNYLIQTLGYQNTIAKIEHPLINNENFYLLARLRIIPAVDEEGNQLCESDLGDLKIIFNIKYPIKHLKSFIKIFIQKDEKNNAIGKEIFSNEEIYLLEGNYVVSIYFKNLICPVKENTADIDIVYSNPNYHIEQIENIEPFIIKDEYCPNRHNIIFKEIIYSCDKVYSSLSIELKEKENIEKEDSINELNDKIKLVILLYQLVDNEDTTIEFVDKKFAHGLRGKKIHKYECFNNLIIPNFSFEGGLLPNAEAKKPGGRRSSITKGELLIKPQFYPYLLICYIDDGFDIKNSIAKNNLNWEIKVFSSDKLCFIKDVSKEEQEKFLKNDWEEKEPGRAEKAKISRKRFILEKIKKEGGKLSEEELNLLNKQEHKKEELGGKGPALKKKKTRLQINALNKKADEKKTIEKQINNLINSKKLPLPNEHCSGYIKNYLKYAYKKRTKKIHNINDQYQKTINNEEIQNEKNKKIEEKLDEFNKITKTEMSNSFYNNFKNNNFNQKEEILNTFYKSDLDNRILENNKLNELVRTRDDLKVQFKKRMNAKSIISDILKNYNIYGYDYSYLLQSYKDTILVLGENYPDEEKLYKIICNKKEEELKNLINRYTNRERNNAIKAIEEVENNKLNISKDIIKKIKELIG